MSQTAKQPDPERERKRAWLNRYRDSLAEQRRLAEQLAEVRSLSTSICVNLNPAKAAPTNAHSDRVADSVQRITALERKLQDDRERRRVQLVARAASKLENGEALNLAEAAVMADSVGMSYGYYSHHLSTQNAARKRNVC